MELSTAMHVVGTHRNIQIHWLLRWSGQCEPRSYNSQKGQEKCKKKFKSMTLLPLCYKKLILLWTTSRLVLRNWQWLVLRDLIFFLSKWMRNSEILNKKAGVLCNYFQINILTWWLFLCTLNKFFHFLSKKKKKKEKKRKSDALTILNVYFGDVKYMHVV